MKCGRSESRHTWNEPQPQPCTRNGAECCCSVMQCVAVCCSVLQCVAVCCNVMQCAAARCVRCSVYSVLQCVTVCWVSLRAYNESRDTYEMSNVTQMKWVMSHVWNDSHHTYEMSHSLKWVTWHLWNGSHVVQCGTVCYSVLQCTGWACAHSL